PNRLFKGDTFFGSCQMCKQNPAELVLKHNHEIDGMYRFCGACLRTLNFDRQKKKKRRQARTCPLCHGKWQAPDDVSSDYGDISSHSSACTTRNFRDIRNCRKYASLYRKLDAEDLVHPYVTAGPYCPWPQTIK